VVARCDQCIIDLGHDSPVPVSHGPGAAELKAWIACSMWELGADQERGTFAQTVMFSIIDTGKKDPAAPAQELDNNLVR